MLKFLFSKLVMVGLLILLQAGVLVGLVWKLSNNLDFRSLYHHYECGVWMYQTDAVMQLKDDFVEMVPVCTPMTVEMCNKTPLHTRIVRGLLRIVAPLM